ncbi:Ac75-like protein [Bombyx mandarina nucleopolyhedrovirus]|uniref:AC75 n=2 Tax=Bombyx mori nuclear polyhedrosis virus TaxID=271108 RepID=O92439_NPVBM|nr:AcMNPV orf75 [Bombyx mori nucleopolyhedrovirus]ACQ57254.1 Ac75-like protein [Bombyx mandarina nucleopolyhedrovirus]AFO10034.1 hypothetical protein Bomanpvs2gp064 [Bombyx mandarina nucleopolyhedrovirus S2]AAC63747.1 AcMNPV orf75 [Bombyx mori nucleopolyhedrovirus]AFN08991.1 hypothetical protein Bmnpvcubicgp064 [Bombyx mori nucleopolyhedrovirus]AFN21037.1 hypothetical protein Bmnpvzhejianggp064 [Bombyx mori nucleopolyhedrovirus]
MSNLMKNFFTELVKSTTFTTKVSVVKTTLSDWLCEQVYPDKDFSLKLKRVINMFLNDEIENDKIYKLVETVDSSNKLSRRQVDFLIHALLNNVSVTFTLHRFVDDNVLTQDELSFLANFLVTKLDEAYQLPAY